MSSYRLDRIAKLNTELVAVENAIASILNGGQSYQIMEGGSQHLTTQASLPTLYKRKNEIESEIDLLQNRRVTKIGTAW